MIEHIWSVLCLNVSVDKETNSVSLFNVLEQLNVFSDKNEEITIPIQFVIVSLWRRQDKPEKGEMRVLFINPDNKIVTPVNMEIDLSEHRIFRSLSKFSGLKINNSGTYRFLVEFRHNNSREWIKCASLPLDISIHPKEK